MFGGEKINLYNKMQSLNKTFHLKCARKNCSDEIIGGIAVLLSLSAFFTQFFYSEQSLDIKSFSIIALSLSVIAEMLFAFQGYQKGSATIILTRIGTCLGFTAFIILWILDHNKKKN